MVRKIEGVVSGLKRAWHMYADFVVDGRCYRVMADIETGRFSAVEWKAIMDMGTTSVAVTHLQANRPGRERRELIEAMVAVVPDSATLACYVEFIHDSTLPRISFYV